MHVIHVTYYFFREQPKRPWCKTLLQIKRNSQWKWLYLFFIFHMFLAGRCYTFRVRSKCIYILRDIVGYIIRFSISWINRLILKPAAVSSGWAFPFKAWLSAYDTLFLWCFQRDYPEEETPDRKQKDMLSIK